MVGMVIGRMMAMMIGMLLAGVVGFEMVGLVVGFEIGMAKGVGDWHRDWHGLAWHGLVIGTEISMVVNGMAIGMVIYPIVVFVVDMRIGIVAI